jgi:hypothetical protein
MKAKRGLRARSIFAALSLLLGAGVSACATTSSSDAPDTVAHYWLPVASFEVKAQYELVSCPTPPTTNSSEADRRAWAAGPQVRITVSLTQNAEVDRTRAFALSPSGLSSARATMNASFTLYENGTLKSVSAVSEDRTSQIVLNVLSSVSSLVRLGSAGGLAAEGVEEYCSPEAYAALREKRRIETAMLQPRQRAEHMAAYETQLSRIVQNRLSFSRTATLQPDRNQRAQWRFSLQPTDEQLTSFFTTAGVNAIRNREQKAVKDRLGLTVEQAGAVPALAIDAMFVPSAFPLSTQWAVPDVAEAELVLREPIRSQLIVCRSLCAAPQAGALSADYVPVPHTRAQRLQTFEVLVPQLNGYSVVPLRAGFFENRTLKLTLGAFGQVETFAWESGARAQGATAALSDISGRALEVERTLQDDPATRQAAQLRLEAGVLNAERELIDAQEKLDAARAAAEGDTGTPPPPPPE